MREINNYEELYPKRGLVIERIPNREEELWNKYVQLNNHRKATYMKDQAKA